MNILISQAEHIFFTQHPVLKFKVEIDNSIITIWSEKNILTTQIEGVESIEAMGSLHLDLLSLYFLCLGSFPKIISLEINNISQEVSELPNKFNTSNYFRRKLSVISNIDNQSINKDTVHSLRQMNAYALSSFQFLLSDAYHDVIQIHKLTLLLHTIDGFISDHEAKSVKEEIKDLWKFEKKRRIGPYKAKIFFLCKNTLFKYDKKFSSKILEVLQIDKYNYVDRVEDTRHWYTHFFEENKKEHRLEDGSEIFIYFEIMIYNLRIYILEHLDIHTNSQYMKEFFFILHDWILDESNDLILPKSNLYK